MSEDVWNFVIRCSPCYNKQQTFDVLVSRLRIVYLELILFLRRQGAPMPYHHCSLFPAYMIAATTPLALFSHACYLTSIWIALNCLPVET